MSRQSWTVLGVAAAVVLVAIAVVAGVRAARHDGPAAPAGVDPPTGAASTRLPSPDDSYWTTERMRSARPAPMPTG
ncbi:hypothetical protein ACFFWC_20390 [Plantactinospora siamensis]|uniref:Uncharacterized protein n=1 Tax=Plantactinospora siamensis TaxID=555372 RepID=A0ABV6P2Y5_9ACTN